MQAQASAYGALAEHKAALPGRQSWMSRMQRTSHPPGEGVTPTPKSVFKARMKASGFAVREVPKKEPDGK